LLEWDRLRARAAGDRWFAAALDDGIPASSSCLFQRGARPGGSVNTLSVARERGLARAVVLAATEASVGDGDELTFICAAARDWPQLLYHRLGFEPVGETPASPAAAYLEMRPIGCCLRRLPGGGSAAGSRRRRADDCGSADDQEGGRVAGVGRDAGAGLGRVDDDPEHHRPRRRPESSGSSAPARWRRRVHRRRPHSRAGSAAP